MADERPEDENEQAIRERIEGPIPIGPDMNLINLTEDVRMELWGDDGEPYNGVIPSGSYFIATRDGTLGLEANYLYAATMESVRWTKGNPLTFRADGRPFSFRVREQPVTVDELFVWTAANWYEDNGRPERARELIRQCSGKAAEELPRQDTKKPRDVFQGLSKVSTQIQQVPNGEEVRFAVGGGSEGAVETILELNYEAEGMEISRRISQWDMVVHDAAASLYVAGNRVMTARQVAQLVTQKGKPSDEMVRKVEESFDRQRFTRVRIDYSAEMRGRNAEYEGEKVESYYHETYMLNASKQKITTAKGTEATGYVLNEAPIIYRHDAAVKQIATYKARQLQAISQGMSSTPGNVMLRRYLMRRISQAKSGHTNDHVRYETIAEYVGVDTSKSRTPLSRLRDRVAKMLDACVTEGLIEGWSEYDESARKKAVGVCLKVPKKARK